MSAFALLASTAAQAFVVGNSEYDDPTPQGASVATKALMQAACANLAAAHAPDIYVGTLDDGSIAGTVIAGSETPSGAQTKSNFVGIGQPIPESIQVATEPYRNGGSVNMFALAQVVAAHYADSSYDFTQSVTWNSNYTFTCKMRETIPVPDQGVHIWTGPSQAGDPAKANCEGDKNPHEYDDRGANCEFQVTIPAHNEYEDRDDEFGDIDQLGETDTLAGHASSGGGQLPVDLNAEPVAPYQVVVCISPSSTGKKLPGEWVKKNGYTGSNCTTSWYNGGGLLAGQHVNTGSNNNVTVPAT